MTHPSRPRPLRARHIAREQMAYTKAQSPLSAGWDGNALLPGTEVLTRDGSLPVDFLTPGDMIVTRDQGFTCVRDIRVRRRWAEVVSIAAGTLGKNRPDRETRLLATQEVLLRDWRAAALFGASTALVPAARIVDGRFVLHEAAQRVTTLELLFDAPHILYADGLEVAGGVLTTAQRDLAKACYPYGD